MCYTQVVPTPEVYLPQLDVEILHQTLYHSKKQKLAVQI